MLTPSAPLLFSFSAVTTGADSEGHEYKNVSELWEAELGAPTDGDAPPERKLQWYEKGVNYWMNVDATVDGVLGGFGHISDTDLEGSRKFLASLGRLTFGPGSGAAAECGAGVGRVTKGLLANLFEKVDLIEPCSKFLAQARVDLASQPKADRFLEMGLEAWVPEPGRYSLIWCQWVLPHLPDDDLVAFFRRASAGLAPGGIIGVKENIATDGFIMDKEDTSITRTLPQYKAIFRRAGLKIVGEALQGGFPKVLFPVRMFALVPDTSALGTEVQLDEPVAAAVTGVAAGTTSEGHAVAHTPKDAST